MSSNQEIDEQVRREHIEGMVEHVQLSLAKWALHMAARLNGTVYLIGSVLHHPDPRDIDIRIVLDDSEFGHRYGMERKPTDRPGYTKCIAWDEDPPPQRWVDDVAKLGRELSHILRHNVDLKVWPRSYWRKDLYPAPLVLAAPSVRWFVHNKYVPDPSDLVTPSEDVKA
jgi:hypothetical protein